MGNTSSCCNSSTKKDDALGEYKEEFLKMINRCPLDKLASKESNYVYDKCGRNMMEMWQSKYFGGTVLQPVRRKDGDFMANNLKEVIFNLSIQPLYGGGYYALRMIPDPENNLIYDIYIIMEEVR